MAALSTSAFTGKAVVAKAQIRAKSSRASVVVKASAADNSKVRFHAIFYVARVADINKTRAGRDRMGARAGFARRTWGAFVATGLLHIEKTLSSRRASRSGALCDADPACTLSGKNPLSWVCADELFSPLTRQVAAVFAAGVVALNASPALALNAIELTDQRATNQNGLQLIYEVRPRTERA